MSPGVIQIRSKDLNKTDSSLHCSLQIEYVVEGRIIVLFNINYDFGEPKAYMLAPKAWKIFSIMPKEYTFGQQVSQVHVCISLPAYM